MVQALQRVLAIGELGAKLVCMDDHLTVFVYAIALLSAQSARDIRWQRQPRQIDAQFHRGGRLVDVLTTGARCVYEPKFQRFVGYGWGDHSYRLMVFAGVFTGGLRLASCLIHAYAYIAKTGEDDE